MEKPVEIARWFLWICVAMCWLWKHYKNRFMQYLESAWFYSADDDDSCQWFAPTIFLVKKVSWFKLWAVQTYTKQTLNAGFFTETLTPAKSYSSSKPQCLFYKYTTMLYTIHVRNCNIYKCQLLKYLILIQRFQPQMEDAASVTRWLLLVSPSNEVPWNWANNIFISNPVMI